MTATEIAAKLTSLEKEREALRSAFEEKMGALTKQREVLVQSFNFQLGAIAGREAMLKEMLSPHPVPQEEPAQSADIAG